MSNNERNSNNIGDSGACSIGEGLKMNSTLRKLDLWVEGLMIHMMSFDDVDMN